jgi:hypothetical protein
MSKIGASFFCLSRIGLKVGARMKMAQLTPAWWLQGASEGVIPAVETLAFFFVMRIGFSIAYTPAGIFPLPLFIHWVSAELASLFVLRTPRRGVHGFLLCDRQTVGAAASSATKTEAQHGRKLPMVSSCDDRFFELLHGRPRY